MAKHPKPGRCVHCLRFSEDRNWDHVFPRSWYPNTTLPNLAKWQVPSCRRCNRELGVIENEFFIRVALCLNPNDPASKSIVQKALRAMKPEFAKSASDRRARTALAKRVTSSMLQGREIPGHGIYPSLGERWGRPSGSGIAVTIPVATFRRITEKIVRGIAYMDGGRYIEPPHSIEFFALTDVGSMEIREVLDKFGTTLAREPGIVVRRAIAQEDGVSSLYEIEFWKQFKTYASVTNKQHGLNVPSLSSGAERASE